MAYDAPDDIPDQIRMRMMGGGLDIRIVSDKPIRQDRLCRMAARMLLNGIDPALVKQLDETLKE